MNRLTQLCILAVLLSACTSGPRIESFAAARSPAGIDVALALEKDLNAGQTLSGELVEVREAGLVILSSSEPANNTAPRELLFVPFRHIVGADVGGVFHYSNRSVNRSIDEEAKERLRLLSRYPQGLSAELLRALLGGLGQDSVTEVGAGQ